MPDAPGKLSLTGGAGVGGTHPLPEAPPPPPKDPAAGGLRSAIFRNSSQFFLQFSQFPPIFRNPFCVWGAHAKAQTTPAQGPRGTRQRGRALCCLRPNAVKLPPPPLPSLFSFFCFACSFALPLAFGLCLVWSWSCLLACVPALCSACVSFDVCFFLYLCCSCHSCCFCLFVMPA